MWSQENVLAYWNDTFFAADVPESYKAFAGSIAELGNLFANLYPKEADWETTLFLALMNMDSRPTEPEEIRRVLAEAIASELGKPVPGGVSSIAFTSRGFVPTPPKPPSPPDPEAAKHREKLRALRLPKSRSAGSRLAAAAFQLKDNFCWVQRGPELVSPVPQFGHRPKGVSNIAINGFDIWVTSRSGAALPRGDMALNCWESVLVSAIHAGVLSMGQLRAAYWAAVAAARGRMGGSLLQVHRTKTLTKSIAADLNAAYDLYVSTLDRMLFGSQSAVPVDLRNGLIPQAGDLIFTDSTGLVGHVCISLGRTWGSGTPTDWVMSLWYHNDGKFSHLKLGELGSGGLRFRPCPF